jgi:hypothetical protein
MHAYEACQIPIISNATVTIGSKITIRWNGDEERLEHLISKDHHALVPWERAQGLPMIQKEGDVLHQG